METILTRRTGLETVLNGLLVFAVLFPFVPGLVPSSDTQPTFLLLFLIAIAFAFASPAVGERLLRVSTGGAAMLVAIAVVVYAWLVIANTTQDAATLPARVVSFTQFALAVVWGYASRQRIRQEHLFAALIVYAVFTVVYFATNGAVEDILVRSRMETSATMLASGRGARTLSPEPSFFALQVFNVYVLGHILVGRAAMTGRREALWFGCTAFCLIASLSGYGIMLLLIVAAATYPRLTLGAGVAAVVTFAALQGYLEAFRSSRAVGLFLLLVENRGTLAEMMLLDPSLSTRLLSFLEYVRTFMAHPLIGDGFSLYQGGGFVSIVAGLGVMALVFFLVVLSRVLRPDLSFTSRALVAGWFTLHFLYGPVGIPIIGATIGWLLRDAEPSLADPVGDGPLTAPDAAP